MVFAGVSLALWTVAALVVGRRRVEWAVDAAVLAAWRACNGPKTAALARRLNARGLRLEGRGDADSLHRAAEYYEEAVRVGRVALGRENPEVTVWLQNLSLALHKAGDYKRAFELMDEALHVLVDQVGADNRLVADWLHTMALAGFVVGPPDFSYDRCVKLTERCVAVRRNLRAGGKPSVELGSALTDLANFVLVADGQASHQAAVLAFSYGQEGYRELEAALGPDHEKTVKARADWT